MLKLISCTLPKQNHEWERLPNIRMEAERGAIRPPKGILAPKMVASPEVGSG
jgi:hypothetical protein